MAYRSKNKPDDKSKFAHYLFSASDFPKYSGDYDEISNYLEWNSPFPNALTVFDELWELYSLKID